MLIHVNGDSVTFDAYREVFDGVWDYRDIVHHGTIYPPAAVYLPWLSVLPARPGSAKRAGAAYGPGTDRASRASTD